MFEHLLSPLVLGPVELPNRIASTAHQTTLVHDHLPTDEFVAYHEARSAGGTGMIVLEATAVHESGRLTAAWPRPSASTGRVSSSSSSTVAAS